MHLAGQPAEVALELTAVVVAVTDDVPQALMVAAVDDRRHGLPSGPFEAGHRTLETGLRAGVEAQTGQALGYVEQLYTFGDHNRSVPQVGTRQVSRAVSVAYLALTGPVDQEEKAAAAWRDWYRYLPWEDWRDGTPSGHAAALARLTAWAEGTSSAADRAVRHERVRLTFGEAPAAWDDERVLERYELLYEAGLAAECWHDQGQTLPGEALPPSLAMVADHRRILATAIGRLRAKIKYRPVLFELMPPAFTLLQLQRTAEAISGVRLHKQNFRRLVESQGLVEETGAVTSDTGGRPAKLMRFRPAVVLERPAPGVRVRATRRASPI
ncbi:MAG: hypothetical protein AAFX81_09990 [Pseudomonadota bacterium]